MSISITDIAKETGLSIATISKYLHKGKLKEQNRIKVEEAIKRLGYVPNVNAQSLRLAKSSIIAICISELHNFFWGELIEQLGKKIKNAGFGTTIYSLNNGLNDNQIISRLASYNVSGAIIISSCDITLEPKKLKDSGIPVVFMDLLSDVGDNFCVTSDNYRGGYMCAQKLIEKGHTHIGFIAGAVFCLTIQDRMRGFRDACKKNHINLKENCCVCGQNTNQAGMEYFKNIVELGSDHPTALACLSGPLGLGCLLEANYENIHIGEDISLISFDDEAYFAYSQPSISVVKQDMNAMAERAVHIIIGQIKTPNEMPQPQIYQIPTFYIERNSIKDMCNVNND